MAERRYFWAFVVALVLFTLGSLFAIYEGVAQGRVIPKRSESPTMAIVDPPRGDRAGGVLVADGGHARLGR